MIKMKFICSTVGISLFFLFTSIPAALATNEFLNEYNRALPFIQQKYREYGFKVEILRNLRFVPSVLYPIGGSFGFMPGPILSSDQEIIQARGQLQREYIDFFLPMINQYAWAIPNAEAIQEIARYSPLLEIGAGQGYWAYLLAKEGADVIAYDNRSWQKEDKRYEKQVNWFDVKDGDENAVSEHSDRNLFLCYPPMGSDYPLASKALRLFSGNYVIYVGGRRGGPTGDDLFYDMLEENFNLVKEVEIPKWPGHEVKLYVYQRKTQTPTP